MTNQTILIGRLTREPINNIMTIAVNRNYKNQNGEYKTDFFNIDLSDTMAQNIIEYCRTGDLIAIKGRLEKSNNDIVNIIAEKITFLSSRGGD